LIIRRFSKARWSVFVTIPAEYIHKWNIRGKDFVVFYDSPTGNIVLQFITQEELREMLKSPKEVIIDETTRS
jgi:bifunctional DNA-binding transcriptional regulator/antitoxin component of YhaV-PrlF toxin-antitoxin module